MAAVTVTTGPIFGGAYNDQLARVLTGLAPGSRRVDPPDIDWAALHDAVRGTIAALEADDDQPPSHPSLFSRGE